MMDEERPVEVTTIGIIYKKLEAIIQLMQSYHLEYFLAGIFVATHLPIVGWIILTAIFTVPSLTLFQHPEWLLKLRYEPNEYAVLFAMMIFSSQVYAIGCLSRALGFK
jgi:hypothetical protein